MSEMLKQVEEFHKEMKGAAKSASEDESVPSLPTGGKEEPPELEASAEDVEATDTKDAPEDAPAAVEEPETLIRIGDKTFKTHAEALRYAEKLEDEKLYSEAYQQGVREAIEAQRIQQAPPPPEEDNFEEEFYSNPKATFQKMTEKARNEALAAMDAERKREQAWRTFEEKYPDIDRRDAELVLAQNMETIGKMTDHEKAMEALARRTRAEYQRIVERYKPRTELHQSKGQAVVSSSSARPSVTNQKKQEGPLTMAQQIKKLKEQKRNSPV